MPRSDPSRRPRRLAQFWGWFAMGCLAAATQAWALDPHRRPDSYSIQGWFTEQGLPSNIVRDIAQARDGYLWLATAHGLARFDGARFTVFNAATHPVLQSNEFYAVVEAADGTLWFGSDTGLYSWREGRFTRFTTMDGLAHNYVRGLALRRDGTVVACTRKGYSFVTSGRITTPDWKKLTGVGRSFLERADGSFLLGTTSGLWRVVDNVPTRLNDDGGLEGNAFLSLVETPDGTSWIGYSGGLYRLRADGTIERFASEQLRGTRVVSIAADRDGNLWLAAASKLCRIANGRVEQADYAAELNGTPLLKLGEDREGGLWIAGMTGLFRLKDTVATTIGSENGLDESCVLTGCEAPDGTSWFGMWYGGVYRYDGRRVERIPGLKALDGARVYGFATDRDGAVLIAAERGLYRYANGVAENFFVPEAEKPLRQKLAEQPDALLPSLAHNWVSAIAVDHTGALWVAGEVALYQRIDRQFRAWTKADGLPDNRFESVLCARNGDVWAVAPDFGVTRRHEDRWKNYLRGREVPGHTLLSLYEDSAGDIWLTTHGGGIARFKHGAWTTFTTEQGLLDDYVHGIIDDEAGNLWISYPRGILRIARTDFDRVQDGTLPLLQPRVFNEADGLSRGEVSPEGRPNAWRTRDGRLWFATDLGVSVIDPRSVRTNLVKPPLYIEAVVVNGNAADIAQPVVVPPGQNDVQIHYTAVSLLAAEKLRFKIRLAPLDSGWIESGGQREVRYAQLPPGDYTFHVKASNHDGEWSAEAHTLAFTVRPYFYQTRWFLGLGVLSLAGATFGIIHMRARLAQHRLAALENTVQARTGELRWKTALLEAQLHSSPDGVLVVDMSGKRVLQNRQFVERWKIPLEIAEDSDTQREIEFIRSQIKEGNASIEILRDLHRGSADARRDEIELKDGTCLDSYSAPVRGSDATPYGRIWIVCDITDRKRAQQQLLVASHRAGMAEIATGVLHNIGNALNSVNVSATLVHDRVRSSKSATLELVGSMLRERSHDLPNFLTLDPRGSMLPGYLISLGDHLGRERTTTLEEIDVLRKNLEHIKHIVAMQQSYAKGVSVTEQVTVTELVDDALRLTGASLTRNNVRLNRELRMTGEITVQRHKVVQILVNLVQNAKQSCNDSGRADKQIDLTSTQENAHVEIAVVDNGGGIAPENLSRLFSHGFTTRKDGHGFGLHNSAIAAKELGGSLRARSDGVGRGATFVLQLPLKPESGSDTLPRTGQTMAPVTS